VTPEAARVGGFTVALRPGYPLSVEDLMKAALISSGNDAAYMLAQASGGTERNFVRRMNRRAAQLGMSRTRFSNATGMPAPHSRDDNHASPRDLLILCKEMNKYKPLMRIAGMGEARIRQGNRSIKLRNHNRLVIDYDEVDGFKTGFTQNARFCLAATANKDDRRIIAIALGVASRDARNQFVKNMLCRYYEALGMGSLQAKNGRMIAPAQKPSPRAVSASKVHRVRKGESLYSIAKAHGCTVSQLKTWNRLRGNVIRPGSRLKINNRERSLRASADRSAEASVVYYKVKPGDTLWRISKKYNGISVKKLMKINNIRQAPELKTGKTIKIVLDKG
jgi:D-alanyl-D-alanine carboxypeptidase (penicillin-binding protein 5/6)